MRLAGGLVVCSQHSVRRPVETTAPVTGKQQLMLVSEGEEVAPGQGVVVLEAMKMENEIQAERGGVLRRMFVAEGQAVEGGDDLYELDSD